MKLYLSSYRTGSKEGVLSRLTSGSKRIGVIRNALDFSDDKRRLDEGRRAEFMALEALGLTPSEIDLREFFGHPGALRECVDELDALWVVGGNAFLLNYAFKASGLDNILLSRGQDEQFLYAGYSAGICVLAPTLKGIDLVDDRKIKAVGYPDQLPMEGVGLLPFSIAPHWKSEHPESEAIEGVVEYFMENKIPFIALGDGEVYTASLTGRPNLATWADAFGAADF